MASENLDCPICYEKYDLSLHLPRIIPICGHTVCSQCIPSLIKRSQNFICPIGNEVHQGNFSSVGSFPPNYELRKTIEKHLEYGFCEDHQKAFEYVCIQDKVKVCTDCALFGAHNGHQIKPLSSFKAEIEKKAQRLEELLQTTKESQKENEKVYEDKRKATIKTIQSRCKELRFVLNAKETEFIYKTNSLYDQAISKLQSETGENSLARQAMTSKLSEYQNIIKSSDPFKLLEEDLSVIWGMIQEASCPNRTNKIEQIFEQIQRDMDSTLSTKVSALEKLDIKQKNFKLIREKTDLKLDERLSSRQEMIEYQAQKLQNPVQNMITDIAIEERQLFVSYPFNESAVKNFDIIQGIQEEITYLEFEISRDIKTLSQEDISNICYIRSKLPKVQEIQILIENFEISDEALLDVLSCLFWKNDFLKGIYLQFDTKGLFERSIFYLAETVLPSAQNLNSLVIWLRNSEVPLKAWNAITQCLCQMAERLICLHFHLPCQEICADSLKKLFISMPNLENFAFEFFSRAFQNQALEAFISNTLPSLKKLKSLQLFLQNSTVADVSVQKLFTTFPQAWFSRLGRFELSLQNTQLSDKSLGEFIDKDLKGFQDLTEFSIKTDNSRISPNMKAKISQLQHFFTSKQKK